jgi:hypothetical protein
MTGNPVVPTFNLMQDRFHLLAVRKIGDRTSRMKLAAGRRVERAGNLPFQKYMIPLGLHNRIRNRDCRKQRFGVGMKGFFV